MEWTQIKREMLKDPAFKREYDALEAEFQLASSIIERRLAKGWSQRQLANRIGTKQPVISRLESGSSKPSLSLLQRVAKALDATVIVTLKPESASPRPRAKSAARAAPQPKPARRPASAAVSGSRAPRAATRKQPIHN